MSILKLSSIRALMEAQGMPFFKINVLENPHTTTKSPAGTNASPADKADPTIESAYELIKDLVSIQSANSPNKVFEITLMKSKTANGSSCVGPNKYRLDEYVSAAQPDPAAPSGNSFSGLGGLPTDPVGMLEHVKGMMAINNELIAPKIEFATEKAMHLAEVKAFERRIAEQDKKEAEWLAEKAELMRAFDSKTEYAKKGFMGALGQIAPMLLEKFVGKSEEAAKPLSGAEAEAQATPEEKAIGCIVDQMVGGFHSGELNLQRLEELDGIVREFIVRKEPQS